MATAALSITSSWTSAASGPASVLIPAVENFHWAIDSSTPSLGLGVCPFRPRGSELSIQLATGENLYVAAAKAFSTMVTTGD